MNKKFTKTLLAGAVFSLLASVAQAKTLHFSLYQGEYDDQTTNKNLSTQKYQMSFDTEAGIGAIFYGTNPMSPLIKINFYSCLTLRVTSLDWPMVLR